MSDGDDELDCRRKLRSNYFQTEFVVSVKKGRGADRSTCSAPGGYDDERKKVSISIQTGHRSMVGAEEIPKERKRWVRPPLVGQASSGSDSQLSIVPVLEDDDDSDDDIVESSQEPFVSTADYPNRRDFISEKPPEGSCTVPPDNRAPSPASASSLTSGRPLEWDSGADVGYFQAYPGGTGTDKLSSLERMALGGSASLLTRSDPEGTVSNFVPPPQLPTSVPHSSTAVNTGQNQTLSTSAAVSVIGTPNAESTPNLPSFKSSGSLRRNKELTAVSHLFPEVIVQQHDHPSDSDNDCGIAKDNIPKSDEMPKRSSSLEDVGACNQQPAPFVRSQSQNNLNFHMSAHLLKMVQPQSNSSCSIATVVKGTQKLHLSDKKDSESGSGADGRANSFEYLPGTVFELPDHARSPSNDPLKTDIERGVRLLSDFVKGSQANNTILKKKLLKKVVDELLSKKYPGEEAWSSGLSPKPVSGNKGNGNSVPPNPPSTWQGLPSALGGAETSGKPWPVNSWPLELANDRCATRRGHSDELHRSEISGESGSQASLLARMDEAGKPSGTSGSTLESSSVAESSIKQHKQPLPGFRKRTIDPKHTNKDKSESRSCSSGSDWKAPATKSEKIYNQLKKKDPIKVVDPGVLRYLHSERENQLDWISKEIDHLSNLKALLEMHESLRKNVENLKKTRERKDRSSSADHRVSRPKRKPAVLTRSEPLQPLKVPKEVSSDNSWESHCYGVNVKGILKKNASTNTFASEKDRDSLKKLISYTIVFDKEKEHVRIPFSSVPVNSNYASPKTSGISIADRDALMKESRERIHQQWRVNLQEELMNKKPDYVARAEMRRQTVAELAAMREVREKNRKKILAAAITGEPAPPLPNPLGVKRVVSQKSMRQLTEKNYKRSSLVLHQQRERKKKEEMVTNRMMADMFNRNLQRRILRGETYLSNSINVL
uniref:ALMS motif domain-containing protein n=1 Tax=Lygus hesperus TaxID=30085 RepID=A0A0K8STE8_LYGHE